MKTKKILLYLSLFIMVVGISCASFPHISDTINRSRINQQIEKFDLSVDNITDIGNITYNEAVEQGLVDKQGYLISKESCERISESPVIIKAELDRLYKDSLYYNNTLKAEQESRLTKSSSYIGSALNLSDYGIFDGIYGYISAPSIDMKLPIYLGANDSNMSMGAAHLCNTSLPIGGKDTNCVLAGHTGYIGRTFFDNLPNLGVGDTINVTNFWGTLHYKVTKTFLRKPTEVNNLFLQNGKELLSLFTCIYHEGEYFRYFVVCERAEPKQ